MSTINPNPHQTTHLNIELSSDLYLNFKQIKGIFPSYLIGVKPDVFLIIKTPTIISTENLLAEGSELSVRYSYLGDVYRFNTTVMGEHAEPFKVTYLVYPEIVEKIEYRHSPRVNSYIPATLWFQKTRVTGIVTDISVAGCKFRTDAMDQLQDLLIRKQGDVSLKFPVLGLDGVREFKGTVKKVSFDNDLALGIGFLEVEDDFRKVIGGYVAKALKFRDR